MIAEFNQRITIQKGAVSSDFFQETSSFSDYYSCFAQVQEKSLSENIRDGNTVLDETMEFTIRSCHKVKEMNSVDYRILFQDRVFDILAIDHDRFSNRLLRITARRCEHERSAAESDS